MNKFIILLLAFLSLGISTKAQYSRYIVRIKDKGATNFNLANPAPYLSQRAIQRRTRYNILIDSSDLPVPSAYVSQIQNIPNVTVLNISRWLNAVTVMTTDQNALSAINALPFVENSSPVAARRVNDSDKIIEEIMPVPKTGRRPDQVKTNYYNYGANSLNEIRLHNGEFLHNIGLRGQGMQIAILDGGFYNYASLKAFDSVNTNSQVLSTWDFVFGHASVAEDHPHGMQCFSTIAANIPGLFIGKAPKASFHLFKTEDVLSEYPIEEFNWACGAERADSSGADIISSSLGYGYGFNDPVPDYSYSDLNGGITMSARAADLAAKKGLLVLNAAGNSGNDYWRMITTPADGDSILAVGAVSTTGMVGSFSSYGPTADGRVKPDVASVGVNAMIQAPDNTIQASNGTSYACPNMAGLATCLWQGFPEYNNMRIVRAIKEAGSIYASPDNRIGYGIPDLKKAFATLLKEFATSSASINDCTATLTWRSKDAGFMKYEIESKSASDAAYKKIATINADAGTLLDNHSYQYNDRLIAVKEGPVSYRIKQIVDTAVASFTAVYIDTAVVMLNQSCQGNGTVNVQTVPNPSSGNTHLVVETDYPVNKMTILIFDMNGRVMQRSTTSKPAGRSTIDLLLQKLTAGKYIIKVNDGNKIIGVSELLKLE